MADQVATNPDFSDGSPVFRLELPGCSGTGVLLPDGGFLVHAGAMGRAETNASFDKHANKYRRQLRKELLDDGTLLIDGDSAKLTRDWQFNSPSAAGGVLTGRHRSWLDKWQDDDGKTLREYQRNRLNSSGDGGPDPERVSPGEIEFRQLWYDAHVGRFVEDEDNYQAAKVATDGFAASADEAFRLLAELPRPGGLDRFIGGMKKWAVAPGTLAFNGFSGQGLLNQLFKQTEEPQRLADLLAESLAVPASDQEAVDKLASMVGYVETIRVGPFPAPGHLPFLLSYFWALGDWERWPVIWPSAARFIEFSTGESLPSDLPEKYRVFVERVRELTSDHVQFETTAAWWQSHGPVFLDEVLADRAAFAARHRDCGGRRPGDQCPGPSEHRQTLGHTACRRRRGSARPPSQSDRAESQQRQTRPMGGLADQQGRRKWTQHESLGKRPGRSRCPAPRSKPSRLDGKGSADPYISRITTAVEFSADLVPKLARMSDSVGPTGQNSSTGGGSTGKSS